MNVHELEDTPPWDWPRDARATLTKTLRDRKSPAKDRILAADLAGNIVVMNDDLAKLLLTVLRDESESADLRAHTAISLGPVLEQCDLDEFEEDEYTESPIEEPTFDQIRKTLYEVYADESQPKEVRRRVLESSVRAENDWHADAIRIAYAANDEEWKLTAVFGMRFVPGFEKEILEALDSRNEEIHIEAVRAAGERELDAAWPHVAALIESPKTQKDLLIAAMEAAAAIRPREVGQLVVDLADSDDEEISEAAHEAMAAHETFGDPDDMEEDEDDEEEDKDF